MVRVVLFVILGVIVWLRLNDEARAEAGEIIRDLSDKVTMLLLRTSSGFADDISADVLAQERERRLRWK